MASKFFAISAYCPYAQSEVGAICTQSLVKPLLGPVGLELLASGFGAVATLDALIASDPGRDTRQVHLVDMQGRVAAHAGNRCVDWCGHRSGDGVSVAGNMLSGAAVVEDTHAAYLESDKKPFAERLLRAMDAG
ncbi:MAG: DUF1028 domain-containing protein, partial [Hyphomicrobiaceae bacterium]|nr:DUF1028 domain-containing protein [Hyphomicrobiaceae bacterium]